LLSAMSTCSLRRPCRRINAESQRFVYTISAAQVGRRSMDSLMSVRTMFHGDGVVGIGPGAPSLGRSHRTASASARSPSPSFLERRGPGRLGSHVNRRAVASAEQLDRQLLDPLRRGLRLDSVERKTRIWRANLPVLVAE
jgi:hypothetical protein